MALLYFDGFEAGDHLLRYTGTGSGSTTTTTRFSIGRALAQLGLQAHRTIPASATVYVGAAMYALTSLDGTPRLGISLWGDTSATRHLTVGMSNAGIVVYRGPFGGTVITPTSSTGATYAPNTWYYIEVKATIADSGGTCTVKVNGATVWDYTGDTKNGGTSTNVDGVRLEANGIEVRVDDFYVCDGTGSAPTNTYLGDVRVVTLAPTGAGTTTGMTPSTGANWAAVDEQPYSATDYVAGVASTKDTYAMADLPSGVASVLAVQTNIIAKKNDAGVLSARTVTRSGGTDYAGTSTALGTSDALIQTMRTTDPATSAAWTTSGVNALEAGAEAV